MATLPQPIVLGGDERDPDRTSPIRQRFELDAWRDQVAPDALPLIVRQTSDLSDGLVRDWPQPGSAVDKHRAYALQWFAMAAVTVYLWWHFALRGRNSPAR
jgi:cytochrome oxidase assembly protein ShyY1